MKKTLVNSDAEFVKIWSDDCDIWEIWEIEDLLNIQFQLKDGTYCPGCSDYSKEYNLNSFRKTDSSQFPKSYPCIVVQTKMEGYEEFEIIYPNDFNKEDSK